MSHWWLSDYYCFITKIGEVENKIPEPCDLVTTTILNIKIGKVENKIPDVSDFVTTAVLNKKNW